MKNEPPKKESPFLNQVTLGTKKTPAVAIREDGTIWTDPDLSDRDLMALLILAITTKQTP